jgi:hypothetical protein
MNNDKVNEVLSGYARTLRTLGNEPRRQENPRQLVTITLSSTRNERNHLLWMCEEAIAMTADRLEKKMRWLGFVQGALWMLGVHSVEELKQHNMPVGEKFDAG